LYNNAWFSFKCFVINHSGLLNSNRALFYNNALRIDIYFLSIFIEFLLELYVPRFMYPWVFPRQKSKIKFPWLTFLYFPCKVLTSVNFSYTTVNPYHLLFWQLKLCYFCRGWTVFWCEDRYSSNVCLFVCLFHFTPFPNSISVI
jgi:hypothetical protein